MLLKSMKNSFILMFVVYYDICGIYSEEESTFQLSSPTFKDGQQFPARYRQMIILHSFLKQTFHISTKN
jgi:phage-related protein